VGIQHECPYGCIAYSSSPDQFRTKFETDLDESCGPMKQVAGRKVGPLPFGAYTDFA